MSAEKLPPEAVIMQLVNGKALTKAVGVAADLGLADLLADGPKTAEELALRADASTDGIYRLLRALAAFGVFEEQPGRRFANNEVSEKLRDDVEGSMRAIAQWWACEFHFKIWNELGHPVRTGESTFAKLFPGEGPFEVLERHPEAQQIFNRAMTGLSNTDGRLIADAYDFARFERIVDVGGGHGALALFIKEKAPESQVTVFDLPHVVEGAKEVLSASDRGVEVHTAGGDFFESVPGPAEAFVMKHIIHDWGDDDCVAILTNCREKLSSADGRVLVCEILVEDGPHGALSKIFDLEMMVGPGGRERTESEFAALFGRAGLKLEQIHRTPGPVCVIEARPE